MLTHWSYVFLVLTHRYVTYFYLRLWCHCIEKRSVRNFSLQWLAIAFRIMQYFIHLGAKQIVKLNNNDYCKDKHYRTVYFVTCWTLYRYVFPTTFWKNRKLIWKLKLKNANIANRVLRLFQLFNEQKWSIGYFQVRCQLWKFTTGDMVFKTKLTSLIDTRELTESDSLKISTLTAIIVGAIT